MLSFFTETFNQIVMITDGAATVIDRAGSGGTDPGRTLQDGLGGVDPSEPRGR